MTYNFANVNTDTIPWAQLEQSPDSTCFFSPQWHDYLRRMGTSLYAVSISCGGTTLGYFIGSRLRLIIKIIWAPSMGTGTYSQGLCMFNPTPQNERIEIYRQLTEWLFRTHQAHYIQVCDWQMRTDSKEWIDNWCNPLLDAAGIHYQPRLTYYLDLNKSEEELWSNLHYKSCKYAINKAKKQGLYVRFVENEKDIDAFVNQHHNHVADVLRRKKNRGLPCQSKKNINALCHALFPDRILMAEVIAPDDDGNSQSISSGTFVLDNKVGSYFTAASYQRFMHLCPNELMMWEGIRAMHARGCSSLILGGVAHYKKKFDPILAFVPVMVFSKFKFLVNIRMHIKKLYQRLIHIFR